MALDGFFDNFHIFIRWLHVIAGITWIGILYFFNFINAQLQKSLDDEGKKAVNPHLMPRALWWFRWGAMYTFVAGLILFVINYLYTPGQGFGPNALWANAAGMTGRAVWITMGMIFGTIMWFNVWFMIWPRQKLLLSGQAPKDQIPDLKAKAGLFSKINTYLSGPMLFGMLGASHYSAMNPVTFVVIMVIGFGAIWLCYQKSGSV